MMYCGSTSSRRNAVLSLRSRSGTSTNSPGRSGNGSVSSPADLSYPSTGSHSGELCVADPAPGQIAARMRFRGSPTPVCAAPAGQPMPEPRHQPVARPRNGTGRTGPQEPADATPGHAVAAGQVAGEGLRPLAGADPVRPLRCSSRRRLGQPEARQVRLLPGYDHRLARCPPAEGGRARRTEPAVAVEHQRAGSVGRGGLDVRRAPARRSCRPGTPHGRDARRRVARPPRERAVVRHRHRPPCRD